MALLAVRLWKLFATDERKARWVGSNPGYTAGIDDRHLVDTIDFCMAYLSHPLIYELDDSGSTVASSDQRVAMSMRYAYNCYTAESKI